LRGVGKKGKWERGVEQKEGVRETKERRKSGEGPKPKEIRNSWYGKHREKTGERPLWLRGVPQNKRKRKKKRPTREIRLQGRSSGARALVVPDTKEEPWPKKKALAGRMETALDRGGSTTMGERRPKKRQVRGQEVEELHPGTQQGGQTTGGGCDEKG